MSSPTFSVSVTEIDTTVTAQAPIDPGISIAERTTPLIALLQQHGLDVSQTLRVAVPAIVDSFDPGPPATVAVQIATDEPFQWNVNGTADGQPIQVKVEYMTPGKGVIPSIPVLQPSAGGWGITFPIEKGDECLLIISDTCIDQWFEAGGVNKVPISTRRHSLSDCIAVFGLRSTPNGLENYARSSMQLRSDDASVVIDLAPGQITLTSPMVTVTGNLAVGAAASGTFTTQDGRVVTVQGGIVTNIG
jgi:hypothetical protein